ncbi:MAG: hypothetical protein HFH35_10780 [Eubacterium sp.]|nr:hypothetical protein [Eubacterium sp.]
MEYKRLTKDAEEESQAKVQKIRYIKIKDRKIKDSKIKDIMIKIAR